MQIARSYPAGTVGGGCFITGRSSLGETERVVVLDIDVEALPVSGQLCINEGAVKLMAGMLELEFADKEATRRMRDRNTKLGNEVKVLRNALAAIVQAAHDVGLEHLLDEVEPELVDA